MGCSSSDVNVTESVNGSLNQVAAIASSNTDIAQSSTYLRGVGFPTRLLVNNGTFMQSLQFQDDLGLDWRIVSVQDVNCLPGYELDLKNSSSDYLEW